MPARVEIELAAWRRRQRQYVNLCDGDAVRLADLSDRQLEDYQVKNGDYGTVVATDRSKMVVIRLVDGRVIRVPFWRLKILSPLETLALQAE